MDRLREKAFQVALYWQSRPAVVKRAVSQLDPVRSDNLRVIEFDRIRVASVQVRVRPVPGPEEYVRQVFPLIAKAVNEGAQLIVLPELVSMGLFGMLPGFDELVGEDLSTALDSVEEGLTLQEVLRFVGPAMVRTYRATFSELSRAFGVYIAAGSTWLPTDDGIRNVGYLFDPTGAVVGTSAKTHLLPTERELGVGRGSELEVFETRIGQLAMPICMDASFFEPIRILVLQEAEIIALPVADAQEYNFWYALRGIWPRVQESPAYGIKACLVGEFMGLKFTGKSGVFAPLELTPDEDGVLAEAESPDEACVLTAELDLVALREHRENSRFHSSLNTELYRRYLPWIYSHETPPAAATWRSMEQQLT
jgi:predicted amidohydrolase